MISLLAFQETGSTHSRAYCLVRLIEIVVVTTLTLCLDRKYFVQLCSAVDHMHSRRVMHRGTHTSSVVSFVT